MTAGTRAKARDYSLPKRCPLHVVVGFSPRSYSVQYFYETHAGAAVELATGRAGRRATGAAPPDTIGIAFIDLNPSHVRLRLGQRELHPFLSLGIESGDFIRTMQGHPHPIARLVYAHGIGAITRSWGIIHRHLFCFVIDLHQLARPPKTDPEVALRICAQPAGKRLFLQRNLELFNLACSRFDAKHLVCIFFSQPDASIARHGEPVSTGILFRGGRIERFPLLGFRIEHPDRAWSRTVDHSVRTDSQAVSTGAPTYR